MYQTSEIGIERRLHPGIACKTFASSRQRLAVLSATRLGLPAESGGRRRRTTIWRAGVFVVIVVEGCETRGVSRMGASGVSGIVVASAMWAGGWAIGNGRHEVGRRRHQRAPVALPGLRSGGRRSLVSAAAVLRLEISASAGRSGISSNRPFADELSAPLTRSRRRSPSHRARSRLNSDGNQTASRLFAPRGPYRRSPAQGRQQFPTGRRDRRRARRDAGAGKAGVLHWADVGGLRVAVGHEARASRYVSALAGFLLIEFAGLLHGQGRSMNGTGPRAVHSRQVAVSAMISPRSGQGPEQEGEREEALFFVSLHNSRRGWRVRGLAAMQ